MKSLEWQNKIMVRVDIDGIYIYDISKHYYHER